MKKRTLILLGAAGVGIGAAAVHSYLDLMYKQTIPKGPAARIQELTDNGDLQDLADMCAENMKWVDEKGLEIIDMKSDRGENLKGYLLMCENESKTFCVFDHG